MFSFYWQRHRLRFSKWVFAILELISRSPRSKVERSPLLACVPCCRSHQTVVHELRDLPNPPDLPSPASKRTMGSKPSSRHRLGKNYWDDMPQLISSRVLRPVTCRKFFGPKWANLPTIKATCTAATLSVSQTSSSLTELLPKSAIISATTEFIAFFGKRFSWRNQEHEDVKWEWAWPTRGDWRFVFLFRN